MSSNTDSKFDNVNPSLYILNECNIYITAEYIEKTLKKYGIDYKVKNLELFQKATTHISYLNRDISYYKNNKITKYICSKDLEPIDKLEKAIPLQENSYERIEFVGDSVIHLALAKYLWARYEDQDEGFMTRLRTKIENGQTLAELAKIIGLNKYILLSRLMEKTGGREKNYHILEDTFEAFMAALFIDSGDNYKMCRKFFITLIEQEIDFAQLLHTENNFKDILLQFFHQKKWQDPSYGVLDISGPDNKKLFTIYVKMRKTPYSEGEVVGNGVGTSKKKGEQEAARNALEYFGIIKEANISDSDTYESFSDISEGDLDDIEIIDDESAEDKNYKLEKKNLSPESNKKRSINNKNILSQEINITELGNHKKNIKKLQCPSCNKDYRKQKHYINHIKKCKII
jgi:dsRNA-specific ribonuclease